MAAFAIANILDIEGLFAVVTPAAEFALGDHVHFHLVRAFRHLEYLIMAFVALEAFPGNMVVVTEKHGLDAPGLGLEQDVSPPHAPRSSDRRQQKAGKKQSSEKFFHCVSPFSSGC